MEGWVFAFLGLVLKLTTYCLTVLLHTYVHSTEYIELLFTLYKYNCSM